MLPNLKDAVELQTKWIGADAALDEEMMTVCDAIRRRVSPNPSELSDLSKLFRPMIDFNSRDKRVQVSFTNLSGKTLKDCVIVLHVKCACELSEAKKLEYVYGAPLLAGFVGLRDATEMTAVYAMRDAALLDLFAAPKGTAAYASTWDPNKHVELDLMPAQTFMHFATELRATITAKTPTKPRTSVVAEIPLTEAKKHVQTQLAAYAKKQQDAVAKKAKAEQIKRQKQFQKQRRKR